jgi:hypothetical protein
VEVIGVYSSRDKAQSAAVRSSRVPGFLVAPDGFHIDEYTIDKDHWVEGYLSVVDVENHKRDKRFSR